MGLDDIFGNAQSQSNAVQMIPDSGGAVELIKQLSLILFQNAGAIVRDTDNQSIGAIPTINPQPDFIFGIRKL